MLTYNNLNGFFNFCKSRTIKNIVITICILIIFKLTYDVSMVLSKFFIYNFYHSFEYEYQKNIVTKMLYTHSLLLYTPIFLSIMAIIKRKVSILDFVIAIILSSLAIRYNWFDIIHNYLQNTCIFDYLKSTGRTIINNQYTRIIIYIITITILAIQVLRKKTRTISRIMILLMTMSCLITVSIFHVAIPMGIYKSILIEKSETQKYEIENYQPKDICKIKNCYNIYEDGTLEIISEVIKPKIMTQYERVISTGIYVLDNKKEKTYSNYTNVNEGFLFDYDIIAMKKEGNKYFTTIDNNIMRKYSRESEIMFSFLTIMAHFTWIVGTLILLEFHNYKFKKRLNKSNI